MSRFVSAGAINAETGEAVPQDTTATPATDAGASTAGSAPKPAAESRKSAEWDLVQRELDAERRRREEARVKSVEGGEKSLYDVLQANKAAKQAAFEEANKIRNQFRALDDDEIGFLDEVREAKRAEEERVRRETEEGLVAFRRAQGGGTGAKRAGDGGEEGEEGDGMGGEGEGGDEWAVGPRKRRRKERERGFGVKREKGGEDKVDEKKADEKGDAEKGAVKGSSIGAATTATITTTTAPAPVKGKLSLVAYGSDSDDE
ncbi:hypothetical protein CABS01_02698 [Colletotrichum abscissum]|uniref:FAM192A/Fyv6 N-terminal domain-containing protein n=1 Tax=Colletotrichum abscissum TaxID=1671311 RepID=A0A9P9XQD0_9PEZI|nr:uncharacterized protein CABS01_02698 [Colletotrichum abscissum]KAI3558134.1 hypothetical protein CABS02_01807 [Colletotrichum abscissum]KAK1482962.1 hypothetical protein CABS01_02698 [Colletotrichum abscissum]